VWTSSNSCHAFTLGKLVQNDMEVIMWNAGAKDPQAEKFSKEIHLIS
jgi:hypothetical protein